MIDEWTDWWRNHINVSSELFHTQNSVTATHILWLAVYRMEIPQTNDAASAAAADEPKEEEEDGESKADEK